MKLIWKGLMLLTVFFIIITFVNAAEPVDCNDAGGIWCGPISGGRCENKVNVLPSNYDTDSCVVSVNNQLVKANSGNLNYSLYSFKINPNIKLRFVSPNTVSIDCNPSEDGGAGGARQTNKPQNGGYYGGAGGSGGKTCKVGNYGTDAERTGDGGGSRAGIPGYISPLVIIQAHDVNISGMLDISGWPGSAGGNAHNDDDDGYGGGGASGGSGGGVLYLYSINITGTGVINASGGTGGTGGQFNDDGGDQCQVSDDPGTGGGGGGGGGSGSIFFSSTPSSSVILDCSGGAGGFGGCYQTSWSEVGNPGSVGDSSASCGVLASLGTESECNDLQDNDLDGLIDMFDSDCQASQYCPNFTQTLLTNGLATDGSDGCCGDDGVGDYGYVTPDNKYLCYNNKSNFNAALTDKWIWIAAYEKPFIITPLNFSSQEGNSYTIDYVSNSENWYFCDATSQAGMGIPVPEYGSFPAPATGGLTSMNCSAAVEILLSGQGYGEFHNCYVDSSPNCCQDTALINLLTNPEDVQECICTISGHSPLSEFCIEFPEHEFCSQEINIGPEDLLKEYCQQNPRNCFTNPTIRTDRLCEETPNNGERCGSGEVCVDGVVIGVSNGPCCIGPERHCEDVTNIDESLCVSLGGEYYQKSENTACLPTEQDVPIGTTYGCCFGVLVNRNSFFFSSFEELNNESFSCFAYEDNGYFGQCCYDNCDNMKQITPNTVYVDNTRNRIFSLGSVYGYFKTYDIYDADPEVSRIVDVLKSDEGTNERIPFELPFLGFAPNLSYYEYLEFDIIYNNPDVGNIYVNNINMGPLKQHISGGDKELVPHHAKVWIRTPELSGQLLNSIEVEVNGETEITIGYDNIFLTAYTPGTRFASVPQYCAGGFTSWISDLDPPITDPSSNFFMGEDAWMEGYGRYVVTCNQQWPYGWTGHYCCGDDTEINTYGEYFTDTAASAWPVFGGCFNGTPVFNEESVWKKRGFLEYDEFYDPRDELKTYLHSDLIYNGDTFVSCQTPSEKYASLRESYDGMTIGSGIVVGENVDDQCVVVGNYYCINNAWRQYIPGIGQVYDQYNNYYSPSIPSSLELKSVPPAAELLKNGDFGGPCPLTVCPEEGGNTGQ